MPPVGEVSFELERFEWTADDRLEVVGRWNGVRGRRIARPALTVDAGGRRQRLSGSQISDGDPDEPWRASFDWDGARGDIAGAELEIGRTWSSSCRRRAGAGAAAPVGAESDLRAQVDELRGDGRRPRRPSARPRSGSAEARRGPRARAGVAARARRRATTGVAPSEAERDRSRRARALRADAAGSSAERLARPPRRGRVAAELADGARSAEAERDRLAAELEAREREHGRRPGARGPAARPRQPAGRARAARGRARGAARRPRRARRARRPARAAAGAPPATRSARRRSLGELIRELQERATAAEAARDRLTAELAAAREEIDALERRRRRAGGGADAAARGRRAARRDRARDDHRGPRPARDRARGGAAHDGRRGRGDRAAARGARRTREDAERLLAAERAEVARLREELLSSEVDEDGRRGLAADARARHRATSSASGRRRATCAASSTRCARTRPSTAARCPSSTANGTLAMDDRRPGAARSARPRARSAASRPPASAPPSACRRSRRRRSACGRCGSSPRCWSPRSASRSSILVSMAT